MKRLFKKNSLNIERLYNKGLVLTMHAHRSFISRIKIGSGMAVQPMRSRIRLNLSRLILLPTSSLLFWLFLHFDEAKGVQSSAQCSERLRQYLPDYDKGIDTRKFTQDRISQAVQRAKLRDTPPCPAWPKTAGTTVYRLVEKLMQPRC